MRLRSTLSALTAAALLLGGVAGVRAQGASLNDVVLATVNGQNVTRGQLVSRLIDYRGDEALDKLINRTLVLQAAARLKGKAVVSEGEVSTRFQDLQNRFRNAAEFQAFLAQSRLTEKRLRDEIYNTILIQKVAVAELPILDDDLQLYDVRMIEQPDKESAEKLVAEIKKGLNFVQAARERNKDVNLKQAVGRLKPFLRIEMMDVAKAVDDQKVGPGGFTEKPVQLGDKKWVLLRLEGIIPPNKVSAVERERLTTAMVAFRVDEWMTKERAKAKIEKKGPSDAVVAVVNGEAVPKAALESWLLKYQGEEQLQQVVNRSILLQAAKRLGVAVPEKEAEEKFQEARKRFPADGEAYQQFLTQNNLTEKQLKDEIRYTLLLQLVAVKDTPITDDDLTRFDVRMIDVPTKAIADAVLKQLNEGKVFSKVAQEFCNNAQARQSGGKLKPFIRTELLDVWRAIDDQKLKKGEYTKKPVLLTDNSYVIILLEDLLPISAASKEEREQLTAGLTKFRIEQWLDLQKANAKISYPTDLSAAIAAAGS